MTKLPTPDEFEAQFLDEDFETRINDPDKASDAYHALYSRMEAAKRVCEAGKKRHPKGAFTHQAEAVHRWECPATHNGRTGKWKAGPCNCGGDELQKEIDEALAEWEKTK